MSDWLQIGADDGIDLKRIIGDRESSLDWKREKEYFVAWTHILTRTTVLVIAIPHDEEGTYHGMVRTFIGYHDADAWELGQRFSTPFVYRVGGFMDAVDVQTAVLATAAFVANLLGLPDQYLDRLRPSSQPPAS